MIVATPARAESLKNEEFERQTAQEIEVSELIKPHGGQVVNRVVTEENREEAGELREGEEAALLDSTGKAVR